MKINIIKTWLNASHSNFLERQKNDDQSLTYQEVYLFYLLRVSSTSADEGDLIDPDYEYDNDDNKEYYIDIWNKLSVSKTKPMTFDKPWDEVFPDYNK